MSFNAFLQVDGIKGESTDAGHKDWIDVLSYSHGVSMPVSMTAGALSAGRSDHQNFSIVKHLDASSPDLAKACCAGKHIAKIVLDIARLIQDNQTVFMTYTMEDVMVASVRPGGSCAGTETVPLEEVSFAYNKITWKYTKYDVKGGSAGSSSPYWNVGENKGG